MAFKESRLKNGTLTLTAGEGGTALDVSCAVTNMRVVSNYDDDGDAVTVLCGETIGAPRKASGRQLSGTIVQDFDYVEADGGIIDYLWNHDLEIVDFTFTPNDVVSGATITGQVQLEVPNDGTYGGDVGGRLTTDFVWNMQGEPTRTYGGGSAPPPATGATAGTPGSWTPAGCEVPADLAAVQAASITASPATAWTTGQSVQTADAADCHWDGSAWATGTAP